MLEYKFNGGKKPNKIYKTYIVPCKKTEYFNISTKVVITISLNKWNKEEIKHWFKVHGGGK